MTIQSKIFLDRLHCSLHVRFFDPWQHVVVFVIVIEFLLACLEMHYFFVYSHYQLKVHLHLWWNSKAASFRFSCAITETFCPLPGIPLHLAFSQHCRCHGQSCQWEVSAYQDTLILALWWASAMGLNPSQMYISWSFKTIISGPCALCIGRIPIYLSWGIILCWRVPFQGIFIFVYSASRLTTLWSWITGSFLGSECSKSTSRL